MPHCGLCHVPNEIDYGRWMLKQIYVQLYLPEGPHWHYGDIKKIEILLLSSLLTLTRFHSFSLGNCCWLCLPSEIKVQANENYETCEHRYKLCYIYQMSQSTTWRKTRIEFNKYTECRFWANIYKIYWDFCSVRIISL